jgi:hypothetical protein
MTGSESLPQPLKAPSTSDCTTTRPRQCAVGSRQWAESTWPAGFGELDGRKSKVEGP